MDPGELFVTIRLATLTPECFAINSALSTYLLKIHFVHLCDCCHAIRTVSFRFFFNFWSKLNYLPYSASAEAYDKIVLTVHTSKCVLSDAAIVEFARTDVAADRFG